MIIVGVTGGIGTGKTTVAEMFRRMGAAVIDADEISHRLIYPGRPAWKKIVSTFGKAGLRRDYFIDRKDREDKETRPVGAGHSRCASFAGRRRPKACRQTRGGGCAA